MTTLEKIGSLKRKEFQSVLKHDRYSGFSDADTKSAKWAFGAMAFYTKKEALAVWRDQRKDFKKLQGAV